MSPRRLLACLVCLAAWMKGADEAALRTAFESRHWFDLHDAVSRNSPLFYRLVSAAAFNDIHGAEKLLKALERSGARGVQITDAHYAMYRLYQRNGFYRRAGIEFRRAADPPAKGATNADWSAAEAMENFPDIAVKSRREGTIGYKKWTGEEYLVVPLKINGHDAEYAMDTGAAMSLVTESEAKRLSLTILPGMPGFDGITGAKTSQGHYAYAARVKIAKMELRNIVFMVLPDNAMDLFQRLPQHQRGAIGMPILLAIGSVRWNRDGLITFGFAASEKSDGELHDPNIGFDGLVPMTYWEVAKHRLAVEFDTGSDRSFVWPLYVRDFPELIPDVSQGKTSLNGITGSNEVRSLTLPQFRFSVGGFPIVYENAPALLQSTIESSSFLYGLFGKDQIDKAQEVSLDLRAMKLTLQ